MTGAEEGGGRAAGAQDGKQPTSSELRRTSHSLSNELSQDTAKGSKS